MIPSPGMKLPNVQGDAAEAGSDQGKLKDRMSSCLLLQRHKHPQMTHRADSGTDPDSHRWAISRSADDVHADYVLHLLLTKHRTAAPKGKKGMALSTAGKLQQLHIQLNHVIHFRCKGGCWSLGGSLPVPAAAFSWPYLAHDGTAALCPPTQRQGASQSRRLLALISSL